MIVRSSERTCLTIMFPSSPKSAKHSADDPRLIRRREWFRKLASSFIGIGLFVVSLRAGFFFLLHPLRQCAG